MTQVALNKSALNKEKRSLKTYNRYLPALELKRQQLMAERQKEKKHLLMLREKIKQLENEAGENIPMLANQKVHVDNLVKSDCKISKQNIVGVAVPVIETFNIQTMPYSLLIKPHWVDSLVKYLEQMIRLRIQLMVAEKRHALLDYATQITSQRVNLFSKILIPKTKNNITKIKIFLSDQDRAGVVNAKISKQKLTDVAS
ncbi:MAG: V-type ATP synthase subunit D [Endozoicomonadaceae bacterium]|nr:V-type ATP synthase subunit D [Endozoicomonadaceae bacterium]